MLTPADLKNRFEHHPPRTVERAELYGQVRKKILTVANFIRRNVPEGREQALAFTKLEEAMFWANAGIARSPEPVGLAINHAPEDAVDVAEPTAA